MLLFSKLIQDFVGKNRENDEGDVFTVKKELSNRGYYFKPIENGIIDVETDTGIRSFQKDNQLKVDGWMRPGGETERAMLAFRVSDDDKIEKEILPPFIQEPKIPGTNIPDRSIPDSGRPRSRIYDPYKAKNDDATVSLLRAKVPNRDIDRSMEIPSPPKDTIRRRKYWDY